MNQSEFLDRLIQQRQSEFEGINPAPSWLDAFKVFQKIESAIQTKDTALLKKSLDQLKSILQSGKAKSEIELDLRKLIQEHAKVQPKGKAQNDTPPLTQEFVRKVQSAIEQEVSDQNVRNRIADRISRHVSQSARSRSGTPSR